MNNPSNSADTNRTQAKSDWKDSTLYYLAVFCPVLIYLALGHYQFRSELENSAWVTDFSYFQLFLLSFPFVSATLSLLGMVFYGPPDDKVPGSEWKWNEDNLLLLTYVSRGNQPGVLRRATGKSLEVLDRLGVRYQLEVVTDEVVAPKFQHEGGLYYVVPSEYQTPNGAQYKARALQYLLDQRTLRLNGEEDSQNIWVMHMDEESTLTPECVLGIHEFMQKYDLGQSEGAIGQGEIKYNAYEYGSHLLTTAIDGGRTGGDLGLFRSQYSLIHRPLVGMHGSYVLIPAVIERQITWDVGGHGSITEDSYFALMAMQQGIRFDWVKGFIREQSPFTFMDIVRQRRRWFCGLSHVARDSKLDFLTTLTLRIYVLFWAITAVMLPIPLVCFTLSLSFGSGVAPYWLFMSAVFCAGLSGAVYAVGVLRNLKDCEIPLSRKISVVIACTASWFLLLPAYAECFGTIYGLLFPVKTFYVVKKDDLDVVDPESAELSPEGQMADGTVPT